MPWPVRCDPAVEIWSKLRLRREKTIKQQDYPLPMQATTAQWVSVGWVWLRKGRRERGILSHDFSPHSPCRPQRHSGWVNIGYDWGKARGKRALNHMTSLHSPHVSWPWVSKTKRWMYTTPKDYPAVWRYSRPSCSVGKEQRWTQRTGQTRPCAGSWVPGAPRQGWPCDPHCGSCVLFLALFRTWRLHGYLEGWTVRVLVLRVRSMDES